MPGSERVDREAGRVTRLLTGPTGPVAATVSFGADAVLLETDGDPKPLVATVRAWLDLDLDPAQIRGAFGSDPRLGPLVAERPGVRRVGYPDAFEAVILTVLGQQVSLAAGRTFAARLVERYGTPGPAGLRSFPSAERLAGADRAELQAVAGVTRARTRTLLAVAAAFADEPDLARAGPQPGTVRDASAARLLALPGIGPWTVSYLRMRLMADPDALPAGDLVLRRALGLIPAADVTSLAEAWRPWRSYAVFHLWSSLAWS